MLQFFKVLLSAMAVAGLAQLLALTILRWSKIDSFIAKRKPIEAALLRTVRFVSIPWLVFLVVAGVFQVADLMVGSPVDPAEAARVAKSLGLTN